MCGFAAIIAPPAGSADLAAVERMSDAIRHRGPDDSGTHVAGHVGFGFRRLAILDLSPAGHQPMVSEDGHLVLMFNGEIFNYVELRRELEGLGHTFRSSGDTEVLLHAYQQWGRHCLPRLNGMWAFLIHDLRAGTVFGSRDRFGIKPLFRYNAGGTVLLGSEIKTILASGLYRGEPNWSRAAAFLSGSTLDLMDRGSETFYAGIEQVPSGSGFEIDARGRWNEWRFWSLEQLPSQTVAEPAAAFAELFEDSVRLRMRSDVPVGVSLSGGLDSTSIISVMAGLMRRNQSAAPGNRLEAFSYITPEFDESPYIAETVRQTGAEFHRIQVDPLGLWNQLPRVLWYHDEPVHSLNALISFEIYRLAASRGVKVMLSGSGADETIGGYPTYFTNFWYTLLRSGRVGEAWRQIGGYAAEMDANPGSVFARAVRHLGQSELRRLPAYRAAARWRRERNPGRRDWLSGDLLDTLRPEPVEYTDNSLDAQLRRSVEVAPLPFYLQIEDRNSMAHSVEARVPFLDYRLVSLLFSLPPEWKMRGPWNKYVLREGMRGRIPESVRTRVDKMGFPVPLGQWFRGELYEPMQDLLASRTTRERGIYDADAVRRGLERHRAGEIEAGHALLNVAQMECWFEREPESQATVAVAAL